MSGQALSLLADIQAGIHREVGKLMAELIPLDPPSWPVRGGDPVRVLELERANRLLRQGHAPCDVAFGLALTRAARLHGAGLVREAALPMVRR